MSRNSRIVFLIVVAAASVCGFAHRFASAAEGLWSGKEIPLAGEILPGGQKLGEVDGMMKDILARHEIPGAAVAITHNGRLILARSYGWADIDARQIVQPTTLFALASVSKPITGVTVLKLVEEGRLKLDDHVFELLGELRAPPGHTLDPRLKQITVRMLLHHAGGWNRAISGDPSSFSQKVERELHVKLPISADDLIYYMNGERLDFDPGSEERYSNYGFIILGRVVEKVTGERYEAYVQKATLDPMGIRAIRMATPRGPDHEPTYLPGEAKRYFVGDAKPLPGGHVVVSGPAGGWCGSAVGLARFMTAIDGSRTSAPFLNERMMRQMLARPEPPLAIRKNGSWFGLGWDTVREIPDWPFGKDLSYGKDGGIAGISTWVEHLPGGIDWIVLFNGSVRKTQKAEDADEPTNGPRTSALQDTRKQMLELLRGVKQWPNGDLFERFR